MPTTVPHTLDYKPRLPVDRGPAPKKKLANNSDFDLSVFRHKEFRRSPNPTKEQINTYGQVVERACWNFYRNNEAFCQNNLLDVDDLRSYGLVWLTNFLGNYLRPDVDENSRLLYTYIRQRFAEFRKSLLRRNLSEFVDVETASIGQRVSFVRESGEHDLINMIAVSTGADSDVDAVDVVKPKTSGELAKALQEMPHDRMIAVLEEAAHNTRIHPDAKAEALKRLTVHKIDCSTCSGESADNGPISGVNRQIRDELGRTYKTAGEAARAIGGIHKKHVKAMLRGEIKEFRGHRFEYC